jgi:hypothetical protein
MTKRQGIWMVATLALMLGIARAQDSPATSSSTSSSSSSAADNNSPQDSSQQSPPPQPMTPGYGENTSAPGPGENPPISGLDQPGLEPHGAPLSYIQPGATVSESADSNVENTAGGGAVQSISRGLGSMELQRLWSHFDLAAQYIGGVAYYNQRDLGWKLLQQMDIDQKITWKRGQLSLRDSFSYLPEGTFGAAYGSLGSEGIASLGSTSFGTFWNGAGVGALGLVPRLSNVSLGDVSENLTPKSAVTAAGGFAVTHFYGNQPGTTIPYLNDTQVSAEVGYDRSLSARTQVALVYGYQGFDFSSVGSSFHSHIILGMYGHRISGKMDFLIAIGPQITSISFQETACSNQALTLLQCIGQQVPIIVQNVGDKRLGGAGRLRLRYQFTRTSLDLSYERFETSGSGFFAGAQSDIASLRVERRLTRVWNSFADLGYARNSRLLPLSTGQLATCNFPGGVTNAQQLTCPGVNANRYTYGFIGGGLHRSFGHNFHGFVSYQFNELSFDNSYCAGLAVCSRIGNRSVGTIGLDWVPRPIRID